MTGRNLMYYVYILHLKNGDLYKVSTANLVERCNEHKNDKVTTTRRQAPALIHYECYKLKSDALRRERFLKTTEGRRLLHQQIRDILLQYKNHSTPS